LLLNIENYKVKKTKKYFEKGLTYVFISGNISKLARNKPIKQVINSVKTVYIHLFPPVISVEYIWIKIFGLNKWLLYIIITYFFVLIYDILLLK